jgi:hypothetical protein
MKIQVTTSPRFPEIGRSAGLRVYRSAGLRVYRSAGLIPADLWTCYLPT